MAGNPDVGSGPDDLDAELARLRLSEAADARRRQASLGRQAAEDASFVGVVQSLAEKAGDVLLTTVAGTRHRARITAVGGDFVILAVDADRRTEIVVTHRAIETVEVPAGAAVTGDTVAPLAVNLAEVLSTMALDRPQVQVVTLSGRAVRGELQLAGVDVLRLRGESLDARAVAVPLAAIAEIVLGADR